ncbi:hypothetical protein [Synechococcus sp. UW140]|uniref:hypothetical protein n=1 Tax=Synechococcus sp. UW140 TaxID=368503 RepID=UPI000E0F84C0|nr:hypothetical protein [Synechococcus sp. UW140]
MSTRAPFHAGLALREGWQGFSRNAGTLVGFTVLAALVWALLSALQAGLLSATSDQEASAGVLLLLLGLLILHAILGLVVSIALLDGGLRSVRGESVSLGDLFAKVGEVPNLIGLQLFAALAVLLGLMAFFIPGLYLAVAYVFSGVALVDGPRSFPDALNLSRRLVTPHWFDVTLFLLVVAGVIALGYLACLVGGFVSVPAGYCMVAAAYQQLLKQSGEAGQG